MNYRTERTSEGGCVTDWVAQRTECTRAVHVTRKLGNAHWPGSLLGMVRVWSSSQKVTLRLNIEYSMAISYHNINCYIPVANVYIPVANVYILFSSAASRSCSSMSLAAEIACGRVSQSRAAQAANHIAPRFPRIIQPITHQISWWDQTGCPHGAAGGKDSHQTSSTSAPAKYLPPQSVLVIVRVGRTHGMSSGSVASFGFLLLWTTKIANCVRWASRSDSGSNPSSFSTSLCSSEIA